MNMLSGVHPPAGPSAHPPGPRLMSVMEGCRLIHLLRQDAAEADGAGCPAVQLLAARNGEGVSSLALDLALIASATVGLRTLLLSAEPARLGEPLRPCVSGATWPAAQPRGGPRPATHWTAARYGWFDALRNVDDAPHGLEMLAATGVPLTLAAIGTGHGLLADWRPLLAALRPRYQLLVVDGPALERSYAGIFAAPLLDTTLMVVAAESTRASAARILRDRLAEAGGHTGGVILNKRRFHIPRALYDRL